MARRRSNKPNLESTVTITEQPESLVEESMPESLEIFSEKSLDEMIQDVVEMEAGIPPDEYIVELLPAPQRQQPKQIAQLKPKPVRAQPRNIPRFTRMV